jgi:hypothetical protein
MSALIVCVSGTQASATAHAAAAGGSLSRFSIIEGVEGVAAVGAADAAAAAAAAAEEDDAVMQLAMQEGVLLANAAAAAGML